MGEVGILPDIFWNLTLTEYTIIASGYIKRNIDEWKRARMIAASFSGVDPRRIIELPGDWDHLELWSKEDIDMVMKKYGLDKKPEWQ